ncbi:hypothetical protein CNYM01_01832 [Colletotrichum nymphaeae SA-01]|uniref:Uncharacterized protein n=1 Tax=Colletotrichum nymphaeae SA-01 TaxID=1460502 RepID=A0A135RQI4_9PEZI|nr:hypothetical protein CNYM01_01832 [Colletotrichum nymphaeae SA-01]
MLSISTSLFLPTSLCLYSPSPLPSHSRSRIRNRSRSRKSNARVRPSGLRHPRQSSAEHLDVARLELTPRAILGDVGRRKNGIAVLGASSNPSMHRGSSRIALEDRQPNAEAIQPRRVLQRVVTVRRPRKRNMHHQQPALPHPRTQNICESRLTSPAAPCPQLLLAMGKEGRPLHELLQYRLDIWHGPFVLKPNA